MEKIVEFRQTVKRPHPEGVDLFLDRVPKRMSAPKGLNLIVRPVLVATNQDEADPHWSMDELPQNAACARQW